MMARKQVNWRAFGYLITRRSAGGVIGGGVPVESSVHWSRDGPEVGLTIMSIALLNLILALRT